MSDSNLYVDFIGEVAKVEPGGELTFGRQADLHIDDNRHLHRVLGRFWSRGDAWWLTNEGRSITIQLGDIMLTDEQRLLLLALAEGTLRDPHNNDELPTNRAVARRLGWSITKFNRKLDNLCNRFTKLGVGGLRG